MGNDINEIIVHLLNILKRKPIDGYEIFVDQSSHFTVESKEGKVDTLETSHSEGMAIRILNHQRMGFSYMTLFHPSPSDRENILSGLEPIVEDAVNSVEAISPDPCFDLVPGIQDLPSHLPIFDDGLEKVSEKEKIEKAKRLEEVTRSIDPARIKKVRKASYQDSLSQTTLINSHGVEYSFFSTLFSISVTAVAEDSGGSEVGWDFDANHFFHHLDVEKVGQEAGRKALERLGGRKIPSGSYPVLIRNQVATEFLSLLAHSFSADQVHKGKSTLKGKRGEKFFSSSLSILDDGLHPTGISTAPIDGEGTPSQQTLLVNEGVVEGYLYDRYWAHRENSSPSGYPVRSTGNSRRHSLKFPPNIGISNFFIKPGSLPYSALLEGLHQGLVVEEVMGLHTVDPISGDFSLGCSGDWVERGRKAHPVKSIALAGNLFELFRNVIGVGEDFRFFGAVGSPSLFVEGLKISGD